MLPKYALYYYYYLLVICFACQDDHYLVVVESLSSTASRPVATTAATGGGGSGSSSSNSRCTRRMLLQQQTAWIWTTTTAVGIITTALPTQPAVAATTSLSENLQLLQQARRQLDAVPDLIKLEKWDSIRAILITPPLADCWAKTARPLLSNYADSIGTVAGDNELAALEGKEDVISHLRYLDMAVYNNVFNPIKTEGETGATRGLIKSYYEDPVNEWKASVAALDGLIQLAE